MKRHWLGFGDIPVGTLFRFQYNAQGRVSETVMTKVSARKFRDYRGEWTTAATSWVKVVTTEELAR